MFLKHIKTYYICPSLEKYAYRKSHMVELIGKIGFDGAIHWVTSGLGPNVDLITATIEILEANMNDEPVLILEDDVEWNGQCSIEAPHGTDAIYLGISRAGGSFYNGYDDGPSTYASVAGRTNIVKVENMLSTHAIVYFSASYKRDVVRRLKGIMGLTNYFSDVVISRLHPYYNVYAYKRPFFYQSALLGGQEKHTNFEIVV